MRSNDEVKILLYDVLKKLVKKNFHKRGFDDTFTTGELKEIKEIDDFLRTVNQHKDHPMFEDTRVKYTCISFRATYIRRNGTEISTFFNHFVNQNSNLEYDYYKHYDIDFAPYSRDIVKSMLAIILDGSDIENVFNMIYEDIHGEVCISDSGWTTIGNCKIHYNDPESVKGHYVYHIKAN